MRRRLLIGVPALLLLGLVGLFLYAKYGDHRERVERLVSNALGRRLTIAGSFDAQVGLVTHLVAEDITLANPAWSSEPAMVHVDRLHGSIDLRSLMRRPVRLGDLRIDGGRVVLEAAGGDGRANWRFDPVRRRKKPRKEGERHGPHLDELFQKVELHDVTLSYRDATGELALEIRTDSLAVQSEAEGLREVNASGEVNGTPVEFAGRLGSLDDLAAGRPVQHELSGRLADLEISSRGRISFVTLDDPDVQLAVRGPDLAWPVQKLGLSADLSGAFRVDGELRPAEEGIALDIEADFDDVHTQVRGTVDTLLNPGKLVLDMTASGPGVDAIQSLPQIQGLPGGGFAVSGGLRHENGATTLHRFQARVGGNSILLDGALGELPGMAGSDLTVNIEVPDLSSFSTLVGADLPSAPLRVSGRALRSREGTSLEDVEVRIGKTTMALAGELGDWPQFSGTSLDVRLVCPDASIFSVLARRDLPVAAAEVRGRIRPGKDQHLLEDVEATLGKDTLQLDGTLVTTDGFVGSDLELRFSGPDLSLLALITGRDDYPVEPFDIAGHFRVLENGHVLDDFQVQLGAATLSLGGTLVTAAGLTGTDVQVQAAGPDTSMVAALGGFEGWPTESFNVQGHVRVLEQGYSVESVEAAIGDLALKADGRLGPLPDANGTDIDFEAGAEDLSTLAGLFGVASLPAGEFGARGHVRFQAGAYQLEDVTARLGEHELAARGTLLPIEGLDGSDITVQLSGPSIADLNRLLSDAGIAGDVGLPAEPYAVTGGLRVHESGYGVRNARVRLGPASLEANGFLGALPDVYGTDFSLTAEGPDGLLLGELLGVKLPRERFSASGRVQRTESGMQFHDVKMHTGGYHVEIDGSLGPWPKLIGTRLDVSGEGPSLELFSPFIDIPVEDAPFTLSGHFDGVPEEFAVRDFAARLGDSDLNGSLRLDLIGKPVLQGDFTSKRINTRRLFGVEPADGAEPEVEEAMDSVAGPELLIPDNPIELAWLDRLDAELHWDIDELTLPLLSLNHARFDLSLQEGHLQVGPLEGEGQYGGTVSGSIAVRPEGKVYGVATRLRAEHLRLTPPTEEKGQKSTPFDARIDLTGTGRSLHGMAGTANGSVIVFQDEGSFDNRAARLLTTDALDKVIETLNPFAKKERYAGVVCGVHVAHVENGVARLDPLALVTDKMKIAGQGMVDLETEKLDLSWTAKPRRGIGLSASVITNPYVKLSGTLSNPRVTVKPLKAATTTAAAFGTAGLALLAKGFWDRFTSTKRACKNAEKKYGID